MTWVQRSVNHCWYCRRYTCASAVGCVGALGFPIGVFTFCLCVCGGLWGSVAVCGGSVLLFVSALWLYVRMSPSSVFFFLCVYGGRFLQLGGNHLSGTLPAFIGSMTSLTWLILENNQLTGTIPTTWSQLLPHITASLGLSLCSNSLSGDAPSWVLSAWRLTLSQCGVATSSCTVRSPRFASSWSRGR